MTFKMPEADAYLVYDKAASNQYACFDDELGDPDGLDIRPLYTADALRYVLEAAALVCDNADCLQNSTFDGAAQAIRAMKEAI